MFFLTADKGLGKIQTVKGYAMTLFLRFQESSFWLIYSHLGESIVVSVEADSTKGQ